MTNDRDHAVRGVQMAVEMQDRMQTLRQKWLRDGFEQPFEIRIRINTGQASIGNFGSKGRMDYTAIGRQVNLAARLQAYCRPGKILISHSTWVLVQEHVSCTPQGEIQVLTRIAERRLTRRRAAGCSMADYNRRFATPARVA